MSGKVSGEESLNGSLDGETETELSKPVGLTGLQNLGNTCYMNAGIQALSNCPQLTGFMMDCGSYIRKPGLAKAYHRLINDMWSSRRPSYVVPVGISQGIKKVCPAFKGYTQHDAQEFLRCLLDQLHEELKEPVIESNPVPSFQTPSQSSCNNITDSRRHLRREGTSSQGLNRPSSSERTSSQGLNHPSSSERTSSQGLNHPSSSERTSSQGLNHPSSSERTSPQGLNRPSSSEESSDGDRVEEYETCDSGLSWDRSIDTNGLAMGSSRLNGQREGTESTCTSGVFLPSFESTGTLMQLTDGSQREFYVNRSMKSIQQEQNQKNVTYRSVISDVFDGKLLSSVQCLTCDNVSTTKETFQDLSLSIPTRDQLNALRHRREGLMDRVHQHRQSRRVGVSRPFTPDHMVTRPCLVDTLDSSGDGSSGWLDGSGVPASVLKTASQPSSQLMSSKATTCTVVTSAKNSGTGSSTPGFFVSPTFSASI